MIGRFGSVLQHLSIDIVIGVVILLRFFCTQSGIEVGFPVYFLLASTVWLIYTSDHLRDAKQAKRPKRARYLFHERNEGSLKIVMGVVIFISIICVFMIPMLVLLGGIFLGALSLIYLVIQSQLSKLGLKELYVSVVYTSGILLVPFILNQNFDLLPFSLLLLATFLNLIIFSWFEEHEDRKDGFNSIATVWNASIVEKVILILLAVGMALTVLYLNTISVYFLVVFVVFSVMVIFRKSLEDAGLYRTIGDGVFLLPIVFELF